MVFIRGNSNLAQDEGNQDKSVPIKNINDDDIWYQALFINPEPCNQNNKISQILDTRGKSEFQKFELEDGRTIADCFPSQGVKFPQELEEIFCKNPVVLSSYYTTVRCILQTRKISQLIAQSWWADRLYNDFLKTSNKDDYQNGRWKCFLDSMDLFLKENNYVHSALDILDGLLAREIFLTANASPRGITEINGNWKDINLSIYKSISEESRETIMVILPSSRCWTGVRLALLLAGQVFRKAYKQEAETYVVQDNKYHQICQPIMSTTEIVSHYSIESSMESFHGQIEEIPIGLGFDLPYLKAIIPYPPIPSEDQVKREDLQKWFSATDDDTELGFFCKNESGEYTTTIENPTPPYPYIPISTS